MANIGELSVRINAKTEQFERSLGDLQGRMKNFGGRVSKVGGTLSKTLTPAILGGAAAIGGLVSKTASYGDELDKTSSKLGVGVEELQDWRHWAEQNGIEAQALERGMGRLNQRIGRATAGNEKYEEAFKDLNVQLKDGEGNIRDTNDVMKDTIQNLMDVEDPAMRSAKASEIFGTRMARDLMPALEDGSLSIEEAIEQMDEHGRITTEQAEQSAEFQDALDNVKKSFMGIVHEIGQDFLPILQDEVFPLIEEKVIPALRDFGERVKDLIDWFTDLDPRWQKVIVAGLAFLAALGPILIVVGKLISAFGTILPVLKLVGKAFMFLLSPIGLKIAAIVAVVAAIWYLWNNWDKVAAWLSDLWETVTDFFADLWGGIVDWFKDLWGDLKDWFFGILGDIQDFFVDLWQNVKDWFFGILEDIQDFWEGLWDDVSGFFTDLWESIKSFFTDTLADLWGNFRGWVSDMIDKAFEFGSNVLSTIIDFISQLPGDVMSWLSDTLSNMVEWGKDMIEEARSSASDLIDTVVDYLSDLPGELLDIGKNMIEDFAKGIRNAIGGVKDAVSSVASTVRDFLPFSPAKEGPLADEPDFGSYLGEGVDGADRELQHKIDGVMSNINLSAPGVGDVGGRSAGAEGDSKEININLENHFGEDVTPAKYKRKQKQMLRELATEWGAS